MSTCHNNPDKSSTEKKLCMKLLVIQCLRDVHSTQQKTKLIVIEVKIVWKRFVMT